MTDLDHFYALLSTYMREQRDDEGLSLAEMAERCRINEDELQALEEGRYAGPPDIEMLSKVRAGYGFDDEDMANIWKMSSVSKLNEVIGMLNDLE